MTNEPKRDTRSLPPHLQAALADIRALTDDEFSEVADRVLSRMTTAERATLLVKLECAKTETKDATIARVTVERDNALNKLDVANEVIEEVRGVVGASAHEETPIAVRRVLRDNAHTIARLRGKVPASDSDRYMTGAEFLASVPEGGVMFDAALEDVIADLEGDR